jgi:hypothetical protein
MLPVMSGLPSGMRQLSNNGFVRNVQDNELTSTNLNRITDQNGRYIRSARGRGAGYAQARGNLNSSLAAANAEQSAIDAAAPIASQDAAAYGAAANQNLDSLGRQQISAEGNATQVQVTGMETGSRENIAMRELMHQREQSELDRRWRTGEREGDQIFRTSERQGDQNWRSSEREGDQNWRTSERQGDQTFRSGESALDRDWRSRESNADRLFQAGQNRIGARNGVFGEIVGTVFSDPTYWRDQAGAAGFIQSWTDTLTPMFDRIFGQQPVSTAAPVVPATPPSGP